MFIQHYEWMLNVCPMQCDDSPFNNDQWGEGGTTKLYVSQNAYKVSLSDVHTCIIANAHLANLSTILPVLY